VREVGDLGQQQRRPLVRGQLVEVRYELTQVGPALDLLVEAPGDRVDLADRL
jgi:hypothetical protein